MKKIIEEQMPEENPAYKRHWISWPMQIVAFKKENIYIYIFLLLGSKFLSYQVSDFPSFRFFMFPSQRGKGRGPMRGLGTDHVISGPMRGLKKFTLWRKQTNRQTDMATQWLNWPSVSEANSVKIPINKTKQKLLKSNNINSWKKNTHRQITNAKFQKDQ